MKKIAMTKELKAKVYSFVIRPAGVIINVQEQGAIVLAHALEDAITTVNTDHPGKSISCVGSVAVEEIIKQTQENDQLWKVAEQTAQPPPHSPVSFLAGLKMAASEYVESKTDKENLTKIITKLEKKYAKVVQ